MCYHHPSLPTALGGPPSSPPLSHPLPFRTHRQPSDPIRAAAIPPRRGRLHGGAAASEAMGFSPSSASAAAALCGISPSASRPRRFSTCHSQVLFNQKSTFLAVLQAQNMNCMPVLIRSVVRSLSSGISNGDNETTEPARILLERLFAKTQNLDSSNSPDNELSMSIEVLKSEFEAALSTLRKKERDLQDAEKRVSVDRMRLNKTQQDLDQREEEITAAFARQREMEKELMKARSDLAVQAKQINNLKLLVQERDEKIASSQDSLYQKTTELEKLKQDMLKKNEAAATMCSEIESKEQLLLKANQALVQQEAKIEELRRKIERNELELAESKKLRKAKEERLQIAEAELEKQTLGWLAAREELKEVAQLASKDIDSIRGTLGDFKRVRSLLDDVRAELIASQESFASSRRQIEDQAVQLQKQALELTDQKHLLMSYTENLEAAELEVKRKAKELRSAQARCGELESQLLQEMEKVEFLEAELSKERESLEQKTKEVDLLQKELAQKEMEYSSSQNLVRARESELVEARYEVQSMKSKLDSIQLVIQEKDSDLLDAQSRLAEVNSDFAELQQLMNSKECQLVQATAELQDKEQRIQIMSRELDEMRLKSSQAESVVQKIAALSAHLAISAEGEEVNIYKLMDDELSSTGTALQLNLTKQKQLEADIEMLRQSLQQKDTDLLAAHETLAAKEEELKAVLSRWDARERELDKLEEELLEDANGIKRLSSLAQESKVDSTMGDIELQRLRTEAAELAAHAATTALRRLADMTREFVRGSNTSTDSGTDLLTSPSQETDEGDSKMEIEKESQFLLEAEKEIVGLFSLTEQLVRDAGTSGAEEQ